MERQTTKTRYKQGNNFITYSVPYGFLDCLHSRKLKALKRTKDGLMDPEGEGRGNGGRNFESKCAHSCAESGRE